MEHFLLSFKMTSYSLKFIKAIRCWKWNRGLLLEILIVCFHFCCLHLFLKNKNKKICDKALFWRTVSHYVENVLRRSWMMLQFWLMQLTNLKKPECQVFRMSSCTLQSMCFIWLACSQWTAKHQKDLSLSHFNTVIK